MSILTVCTANVCRSPLLERVLQVSLDRALGGRVLAVGSAGTHARPGVAPLDVVRELVAERGGDPDGLVSRPLTAELVADASLVLTATREHRAAVARLHSSGLRTAFTVREFARLLDGLDLPVPDGDAASPADTLVTLVARAAGRRGTLPPVSAADDAVPDPVGRGRAAFVHALALMLPTVDALTSALHRTTRR